ncbi:MAG: hypothetical protein HGA77_11065 [Chlorobiaceae bacterium]|nr:hypothetical protein [Chlorobiaceae bacterium]
MHKKVAGLFIVFACMTASPSFAADAPLLKSQEINLAGTTWSGNDSDGERYMFTFKNDGTIIYKSDKETIEKGEWKQYQNAVYYEANKGFVRALGEIVDGRIEGKSWNVKNSSWFWKLTRAN